MSKMMSNQMMQLSVVAMLAVAAVGCGKDADPVGVDRKLVGQPADATIDWNRVEPALSCAGLCGKVAAAESGYCGCDEACSTKGDCCADAGVTCFSVQSTPCEAAGNTCVSGTSCPNNAPIVQLGCIDGPSAPSTCCQINATGGPTTDCGKAGGLCKTGYNACAAKETPSALSCGKVGIETTCCLPSGNY